MLSKQLLVKHLQINWEAIICQNKNQTHDEASKANNQEEENLFVATCFSSAESSQNWLNDNGCTNHTTNKKDLFKKLSNISTLKVQVGDEKFLTMNGKGTVAILTSKGTKLICDVLYVPEIDQNLLSVWQLV